MVRLILALLGGLHLLWGVPAVFAPRWFFDHFPGLGHRWTAAYQPYNEHLMTDVGAAFTTLGVLLVIAAALADRKVTAVVLTGLIVFSTIHLGYHALHHGALNGRELAYSITSLALGVLAPVFAVVLNARAARTDRNSL
ncbi:MAG TPA: hypothetical protein DGT23_15545 [Micromonosporaceae bacterium]|nr:hypothetical protein [Micromonosporaceae bacterium]